MSRAGHEVTGREKLFRTRPTSSPEFVTDCVVILTRNLTNFPSDELLAEKCVLQTTIMNDNVHSLILNVLRVEPSCQIATGEASNRHFAVVCESTNEPYALPRPVFRP